MPNFRRNFVPGGVYFFTVVTDRRAPIFNDPRARDFLGTAFRECRIRQPFHTDAIVLLPEHLHTIWTPPPGDDAYPQRWVRIKRSFTRAWLAAGGREQAITAGRQREGRRGVLQPKYWEHTIQDERDLERHVEYIHYNPVRHGLAACPAIGRIRAFFDGSAPVIIRPIGDVERSNSARVRSYSTTSKRRRWNDLGDRGQS